MSQIPGIYPAIKAGYFAAPRLLHSIETAKQGKNPYPFHFKKTIKDREQLMKEKADWKKSEQRKRWQRKEFYIHVKYIF